MNKEQKLALLQKWKDAYDRNELATKPLRELVGDIPHDSAIYKALWDTFEQLTLTTGMLLNHDSDDERNSFLILKWFEIDCDMGAHPQKMGGVLIDSLDKLVGFL
jgi:hypothetical protein